MKAIKISTTTLKIRLSDAFHAAKKAALAADPGEGFHADAGTCNFDTPAFRVDRARLSTIEAAAKGAGLEVDDFTWFGGRRWYWLRVPLYGQAERRSKMSHAATSALRDALADLPQVRVCEYCQMD